jgi:hypothetical protein
MLFFGTDMHRTSVQPAHSRAEVPSWKQSKLESWNLELETSLSCWNNLS